MSPDRSGCAGTARGQDRDNSPTGGKPPPPFFMALAAALPMITCATPSGKVAAIYARYSTKFQDSIDDQVRECREWAEANCYEVPEEFVFVDKARRGGSSRRKGLQALQETIEAGKVGAVVIFATNRLFRKTYRALQFVNEEIVERRIRCVFVKSHIDTADKDDWETRLHIQSLVDEFQTRSTKEHIRAAHIGQLLRKEVFGTLTYGYRGEAIPGEKTNTGKPARRIVIDPQTSSWVENVFAWYVGDRMSMSAVVRRLNEQKAPLPPRCGTGRWTSLAVRNLLTNPRYMGRWEYGRTEAKWMSKKDYVRQVERDVPLKVEHHEDLRIIDDGTWHKAQELMADSPHNAGRKPVDGRRATRPKLLNGLLYCAYHDRPLVVGGANGGAYICPICKADGRGQLYSLLQRLLALRIICERIAELIRGDDALVARVIDACRVAAENQQRPDPTQIEGLRQRVQRLTRQVSHAMDLPGQTEEDLRENRAKIAQLRRERANVNAEAAKLEAAANKPVRVPTKQEVRDLLDSLAEVLMRAAEGDDERTFGEARRIIEDVTGGKIAVYQAGPRKARKGWLRGEFHVRILDLALLAYGVADDGDGTVAVKCEFREPPVHERIADEVKALFDEGLKYTEIAKKIGYNRNLVAEALTFWHKDRGLSAPDGRKHVSRLKRSPRLAERIADQVMARVRQDAPLQEIAKELGTGRNTITKAVRAWHEQRGLPVPDGRVLRKMRNARKRNR